MRTTIIIAASLIVIHMIGRGLSDFDKFLMSDFGWGFVAGGFAIWTAAVIDNKMDELKKAKKDK